MFTEVEPTAAAAAAAHWLRAAVDVTLELTGGTDPKEVLAKAADSEGFDLTAPGIVLDLMRSGNTPLDATQCLVRSAMLAAKGMLVVGDPDASIGDPDGDSRFTVLDPLRPARCLLVCLTRAVQICAVVFAEHCEPDGDGDWMELTRDRFDTAVRTEAAPTAHRLLSASD